MTRRSTPTTTKTNCSTMTEKEVSRGTNFSRQRRSLRDLRLASLGWPKTIGTGWPNSPDYALWSPAAVLRARSWFAWRWWCGTSARTSAWRIWTTRPCRGRPMSPLSQHRWRSRRRRPTSVWNGLRVAPNISTATSHKRQREERSPNHPCSARTLDYRNAPPEMRKTPTFRWGSFKKSRRRPTLPGGDPQVPSALVGLTAVFGMGTGISPPP